MSRAVLLSSYEATLAFGERLQAQLRAGDVLALNGPLGVGKTVLVHGIAAGLALRLGVEPPPICSPSYTIINSYCLGPLTLYHMDLYRLSSFDDLESTGYWDAVEDPQAISIIEWLNQVEHAAPPQSCQLELSFEASADPHTAPRRVHLKEGGSAVLFERLNSLWTKTATDH